MDTESFEYELGDEHIAFTLDEAVYNRHAIYGAAYLFVDRCFLWLSQPSEGHVRVRLKAKEEVDDTALHALAGESNCRA